LRRSEVGQQQGRALRRVGPVGPQQLGIVEQPPPGAERHGDPVLGGRADEARVDVLGLGRAARHRRDHQGCGEAGPEQIGLEGDRGEVALGERAVTQAHGLEAGAGGVRHAGPAAMRR
jgi:hypothetical protein